MEKNEVSIHEVKLYQALKTNPDAWVTSKYLAKQAGIAERTSRALLLKLVRMGVVDQAEVFPAHRYRISDKASKRNGGYVQRLEFSTEVFGLATN